MAASSGELKLKLLFPLFAYVEDRFGAEALDRISNEVGLENSAALRKDCWITTELFDALLVAARRLMASDDELKQACCYQLERNYGLLIYLLRTISVREFYKLIARTGHLISKVSRFEVTAENATSLTLRYSSNKPESRLICLSRMGQLAETPTLFGLPAARLSEKSCIARGDPACEYELSWASQSQWPIAVLCGALASSVSLLIFPEQLIFSFLFFVIGAQFAHCVDLRRANKLNLSLIQAISQVSLEMAQEASASQEEVLALNERQVRWNHYLEEQIEERTSTLHRVIDQIKRMREERITNLRGFSHDLRNPLTLLKMQQHFLRRTAKDSKQIETLDDMRKTIDRMDRLLEALLSSAMSEATRRDLVLSELDVSILADLLKRRLNALVIGRNIRVIANADNSSPAKIETDLVLFDRVIDNLLTNAAKYTQRGSISVDIAGEQDMLSIKLADTGRGFAPEQLENVFRANYADEAFFSKGRAPNNGHGVGLHGVVILLARIGGRLEVMSKLGVGTTFRVLFPKSICAADPKGLPPCDASLERDYFDRVVAIRSDL